MRKSFIIPLMLLSFFVAANCNAQAIIQHGSKTLVAYFSGTGTTQRVANRIAEILGTDIYRIEAAEPYASNPYDDSNRIQNEAYNDLRPADDAGIEMPGSANGVEAWLRKIGVIGNNVTGIATVDASLKKSVYDVYALNGTQVLNHASSLALLASGLYIVNGKKVIVK